MLSNLLFILVALGLIALAGVWAEPSAARLAADAAERSTALLAKFLRSRAAGKEAARMAYRRCFRAVWEHGR